MKRRRDNDEAEPASASGFFTQPTATKTTPINTSDAPTTTNTSTPFVEDPSAKRKRYTACDANGSSKNNSNSPFTPIFSAKNHGHGGVAITASTQENGLETPFTKNWSSTSRPPSGNSSAGVQSAVTSRIQPASANSTVRYSQVKDQSAHALSGCRFPTHTSETLASTSTESPTCESDCSIESGTSSSFYMLLSEAERAAIANGLVDHTQAKPRLVGRRFDLGSFQVFPHLPFPKDVQRNGKFVISSDDNCLEKNQRAVLDVAVEVWFDVEQHSKERYKKVKFQNKIPTITFLKALNREFSLSRPYWKTHYCTASMLQRLQEKVCAEAEEQMRKDEQQRHKKENELLCQQQRIQELESMLQEAQQRALQMGEQHAQAMQQQQQHFLQAEQNRLSIANAHSLQIAKEHGAQLKQSNELNERNVQSFSNLLQEHRESQERMQGAYLQADQKHSESQERMQGAYLQAEQKHISIANAHSLQITKEHGAQLMQSNESTRNLLQEHRESQERMQGQYLQAEQKLRSDSSAHVQYLQDQYLQAQIQMQAKNHQHELNLVNQLKGNGSHGTINQSSTFGTATIVPDSPARPPVFAVAQPNAAAVGTPTFPQSDANLQAPVVPFSKGQKVWYSITKAQEVPAEIVSVNTFPPPPSYQIRILDPSMYGREKNTEHERLRAA